MIDLSKLEVGDTVKFRCGGEEKVMCIRACLSSGANHSKAFNLSFNVSNKDITTFEIDGECQLYRSFLDIIEIIPKPFDWKDVKQGMAFVMQSGKYRHIFVAKDHRGFYVFETPDFNKLAYVGIMDDALQDLTRSPENDIK